MVRTARLGKVAPSLGSGVYSLAEVSRYTQLHSGRVRAWFRGRSDGAGRGPVFASDYPAVDQDYAVSFLDLVDVLVAGQFRDSGVTMQVVRKTYEILQRQLDTQHPFCHGALYTDGRRIFVSAADQVGDTTLSEVISRQQFFRHVRDYLKHIDYGETSRLATRWRIGEGVIIDPRISFGKPVIADTGLTTFVLANAFAANHKDAALVADLFDVGESDVRNAVDFERRSRIDKAA